LDELIWEMTKPHTQEEIAKRLGVSQKTVHKIEARALKKLRELTSEDWKEDLTSSDHIEQVGIKLR
jgi:DNA-directed RNA polymerase sigma subunit (sigma70/sigma32)